MRAASLPARAMRAPVQAPAQVAADAVKRANTVAKAAREAVADVADARQV